MSLILKRLFAKKDPSLIESDTKNSEYKKTLTAWDLVCLGIGNIVGAGIFVLTGKAARENAGPGIVFSFIIAGVVSSFSSLCYAELASTLPVSGSAYSYTYATLGEIIAWIIGWDLMLEYLVGAATVAVGWSGYFVFLVQDIANNENLFDQRFINAPFVWLEDGQTLPWNETAHAISAGFYSNQVKCPWDGNQLCNAVINVITVIILVCMSILMFGVRESAIFNNTMVAVKLVIILTFIFFGIKFINPANYNPMVPPNTGVRGEYGTSGVLEAAVSVFFAYIGFDAVTTASQEAINPQRDLPIGIIGSLSVCTLLYISVCLVLTGMQNYKLIDINAPVAGAVRQYGYPVLTIFTEVGAVAGLTSVLLTSLLGQPRIFQAMSIDGLFPPFFAQIHPTRKTPYAATLTSSLICAALASLLPVDLLGNLTSVGTLFAFFLVSISVIVLRVTNPNLKRGFLIPGGKLVGGFVIPGLSATATLFLISQAAVSSIWRIIIWLAVGLVLYFGYGYHHSVIGNKISKEEGFTGSFELLSRGRTSVISQSTETSSKSNDDSWVN
ncbi:Cationic amino acid transporter-1 [Boothiomyces sp. JEL0866]|nr:Cationic amino acid transporter-1 [Boothiomyces sp. JEL0866]